MVTSRKGGNKFPRSAVRGQLQNASVVLAAFPVDRQDSDRRLFLAGDPDPAWNRLSLLA